MKYHAFPTDGGFVGAAVSELGLTRLTLPKATREKALEAIGPDAMSSDPPDAAVFEELETQLRRYFAGEAVEFTDVALDLEGVTPFQRAALGEARRIPRGAVRSYGQVAAATGRPGAARAVGAVMASNPVCIVIPCHRVVAADGGLGGFGGGLEMKRRMLEMEGAL